MSRTFAIHAASFASLPAVLLQSTMQLLDRGELLRLARCSRFTLHSADSAFAWRCCPTLKIVRQPEAVIPPSRLLRFLPVSLQIPLSGPQCLEPLFPLIATLRVVELRLGSMQLVDGLAMRLFIPASRFHSLRSLQIALPSTDTLRYVAQLPKLESLEIYGPVEDAEILQALRDAPHLTSLSVSDPPSRWNRSKQHSCLPIVSSFPALRKLAINTPAFNSEGSFLRFATAPCIAQNLTELRLTNWQPMKCTTAELGPAFAAMRSLTSLICEYNNAMNVVLRVLHHCPSLTWLSFKNCHYSLKLLLSVLQWMPNLHLELVSRIEADKGDRCVLEREHNTLQAGLDTPRVTIKLM